MWKNHPGLIWSNPNAGDTAFLCAALLHPRFRTLLEAATIFGLDRLRTEWELLLRTEAAEAMRAAPAVARILGNISLGIARAAAGH